jgi:hypothetical protein
MKIPKLSKDEVLELLHEYQTALRKYEFYANETKEAIRKLEKRLAGAQVDEETVKRKPGRPKKATKKNKPGRPKKTAILEKSESETKIIKKGNVAKRRKSTAKKAAVKALAAKPGRKKKPAKRGRKPAPKKRGRKPTKKQPRNYKLSSWDILIMKALDDKKLALIKSEFVEAAKAEAELSKNMTDDQLNIKVSQSLHKLSGSRKRLVKVKYYGKGFAYALKEWVTRKGELMKQYRR